MKKLFLLFYIFFLAVSLFSEVNFEHVFGFQKIASNDEIAHLQFYDYNDDGIDELIASYSGYEYCRIVCYSLEGDTLQSYTLQIDSYDTVSNSFLIFDQDNETKMLFTYNAGNTIKYELYDFDSFSILDSLEYNFYNYYRVNEFSNIIISNTNADSLFYIGSRLSNLGSVEFEDTFTSKISLMNNQLDFVELINDYGLKYLYYPEYETIISIGMNSISTVGAWPCTTMEYNLGLLSNDLYSTIQPVLSVQGNAEWSYPALYEDYPVNYCLLTLNDDNYIDYGLTLYYRTLDSDDGTINHYRCYNSNFSELLWYSNDSNINNYYIRSSTCVPVNGENHFVMYFRSNQLEIRDRINGNIVHFQDTSITPFEIIKNSNSELFFFVEQEGETGYDVYMLDGDIQVSAEDNQISIAYHELKNYPNPFNPTTTISFSIADYTKNTELVIYNLKGQEIRQFSISDDQHSIVWNGTDENNYSVSSGIYFYKLRNGNYTSTKKMILLK